MIHLRWLISVLFIFLCAPPAWAQKTDLVVLRNGDRITGEVKNMRNAKLQFSTDDAGTLYIEWNKILALTAKAYFEVEVEDGTVYYGSLEPGDLRSEIDVISDTARVSLFKFAVVAITPIKNRFWARVNGAASLGFSYTKASEVAQYNLNGDVNHRSKEGMTSATLTAVNTAQTDKENSRRNNLTLRYTRFLRHRWYVGGSVSSEQNTELGIDLRLAVGGAAARSLVQTNEDWFYWIAGLQGNYENTTGDTPGKFNLEAPAGLSYSKFRYDAPEIDLHSNLTVYTNLTTFGRFRFEFDNTVMWKFIKDFTLNLTLYTSFDNKPPSETAAKFDIGTTISVGWTYNR